MALSCTNGEGSSLETEPYVADSAYVQKDKKLVTQQLKTIKSEEWKVFEQLLSKANYWQMTAKPKKPVMGFDGAQWVLEGVSDRQYHVVDRWSPRDSDYAAIGKYLISLTDLKIKKTEIY